MIRSSRFLVSALAIFSFSACTKMGGVPGNPEKSGEENITYAMVNGKEIKGKDVLDKIKNDLAELRRNEYELKRRATEEVVQQTVLEEEAKRQGISVDKLYSQFDSLRDRDVDKDDIKNFLKQRGIEEGKLTKQEKESIPQIIKMQRVYEARQKYVSELRSKANVQIKLQKPEEKRVEIAVGSGTPIGPTKAKVTIIEFSDFQCPFCAQGRKRVEDIVEKYHDKVKVYFRNFPLEQIHPQALLAAQAGACALDQNRFWDFHNMMFDHQNKLDEKNLIEAAKQIRLDDKSFAECLKSGKKEAEVRKDMADGAKAGVNSTPTFFVNGRTVRGAQPLEAFSEIIDEELGK